MSNGMARRVSPPGSQPKCRKDTAEFSSVFLVDHTAGKNPGGPINNGLPGFFLLNDHISIAGMLKKAASGVLAILPCSRTPCTLRASKGMRPCWIDPSERLRACFFEHSLQLLMAVSSWAFICHWSEIFNSPIACRF